MSPPTESDFLVPMALKHWAREALKANQQLLICLNKYPNPLGVSTDIVPIIQHCLTELSSTNMEIDQRLPGWLKTHANVAST